MADIDHVARRRRIIVANGIAQFAVIALLILKPWQTDDGFMTLAPVGRDFVNFWLGGHFAITGQLDLLADWAGYNRWISETFQRDPREWFIFSYPPHMLLFLVPFGAIHHLPAVFLWTILNLYFVARTVRLMSPDPTLVLITCLSPAALMMVAFGHFTGVLAFIAVYVLLRGRERPITAGMLLALTSVKPQLALVFGLVLLCTGYWRVILYAVPATLFLVGASVLAFGIKPWVNFVEWTLPMQQRFIYEFNYDALLVMISLYCGLRLVGFPHWTANTLQWVFSLFVLAKSVQLVNRQGVDPRTITIVLFAAVCALPYFNCYDLALFAPALTVALFGTAERDMPPFLPFVPTLALWLLPIYAVPFGMAAKPVVHFTLAGLLLYLLFRQSRVGARDRTEPALSGNPDYPVGAVAKSAE